MRQKKEKKENSERWLLTYSDLITLLMILFVLLYSFSNIDKEKYEQLAKSLNAAMGDGVLSSGNGISEGDGVLDGGNGILDGGLGETEEETTSAGNAEELTEEEQLLNIESQMMDIIKNTDLVDHVYFTIEDKGLIVSFADNIFFDSGKADVKVDMMTDFDKIADILKQFGNPIRIEGHTDNVPIHNSDFASNWQLSAERAANVVQYLVENDGIQPNRLSAVGYGEYKPVASNDTKEGRDRNRRVNLVILYDDISE